MEGRRVAESSRGRGHGASPNHLLLRFVPWGQKSWAVSSKIWKHCRKWPTQTPCHITNTQTFASSLTGLRCWCPKARVQRQEHAPADNGSLYLMGNQSGQENVWFHSCTSMPWHIRARDWRPQSACERDFEVKDARQKATGVYHTWVRFPDKNRDRLPQKNLFGVFEIGVHRRSPTWGSKPPAPWIHECSPKLAPTEHSGSEWAIAAWYHMRLHGTTAAPNLREPLLYSLTRELFSKERESY